jgi:hypothetical protein
MPVNNLHEEIQNSATNERCQPLFKAQGGCIKMIDMKLVSWTKLSFIILGLTLAGCLGSPVEGQGLVPIEAGCVSSDECDASADGAGLICVAGQCTSCRNDSNCKPYGDGAICWDRRCQAVESCADDVCDTPPTGTCDGKTAIRYSAVGQCAQGECAYDSDERQCANDESCLNGECFSDALCADVVCDTPPAPGCDEINTNDVISYGSQGSCQPDGSCTYPETPSSCADGDVCTNGVCYAPDDPCAGFPCDAPPAGTCNGKIAISYGETGECDSSTGGPVCDYSERATEELCTGTDVCLGGACLGWCDDLVKSCDNPPVNTCGDNGGVATSFASLGTCDELTGECDYRRLEDGFSEDFCRSLKYKVCNEAAGKASCGECLDGSTPNNDGECTSDCGVGMYESTRLGSEGCTACNCGTGEEVDGSGACVQNPSAEGNALCHPAPGYFVSKSAAENGTDSYIKNCDSDNDGWVNRDAFEISGFLNGATANSLVELLASEEFFKCEVRVVGSVTLINDKCESLVLPLSKKVTLAENQAIDSTDQQTEEQLENNTLQLRASYLNPLTKGCSDFADYNSNGDKDLKEYGNRITTNGMYTITDEEVFFNDFSYFMELYDGYYEGQENNLRSCSSPQDAACGTYVIKEKPRAGSPNCDATANMEENQVPIKYHQDENDYWKSCERRDDSDFGKSQAKVGLDFAGLSSTGEFTGFFHHSQYKCVRIDDSNQTGELTTSDGEKPLNLNPMDLYAGPDSLMNYQWNNCTEGTERASMGNETNSTLPGFHCIADKPGSGLDSEPVHGKVGWVAVRYMDYGSREQSDPENVGDLGETYIRGCVNECENADEPPTACFNAGAPEQGGRCSGDVHNFGELICGCGTSYGGPKCQIGCPADYVHITETFNLANRKNTNAPSGTLSNIWMCMRPVSSYGVLETPADAVDTPRYKLHGRVPISATNRQELSNGSQCDPSSATPCYTLR